LPSPLSAQGLSLLISALGAFQLQLTPFNSTPISSLVWNGPQSPVISASTSGDVAAKTTGAASVRYDTKSGKYKYGVQFTTKV